MIMESLQLYWWLLISVLGAALVFLLFVQGGQSMLLHRLSPQHRAVMIEALGHKWELSFTTLVVFGGAFFASFPLFYSTSFGGAYWLWMLILFSFILQAVSYEFRSKPGNIFGERTYDVFLFINGCVGCVLLGVAVGMMFFGAEFTVTKSNLLDNSAPVISTWAPTHGLEAIADWRNLLLGIAVLFLARTQASLYFINCTDGYDARFDAAQRRSVLINGVIFVVFFLGFHAVLLTSRGQQGMLGGDLNDFEWIDYKYLHNFLDMPGVIVAFLIGVLMVLGGIVGTLVWPYWRGGIWYTGLGTVFVVISLFFVAGLCNTPYYPSLQDTESSLSIFNSSSSEFTLTCMSWVSVIVPFVIGYIVYVWRAMDRH
ncbi:MAG: cytochrome d ubiquinol oxidase subunit II [Muribaculaceae bacterium]|nr:cytochrome d ubiquinol oxidase subunit II [Muribaculaceae bacterium]